MNQVSNTNATCRVCLTCRSGYSLGKDGVTCGLCPNRDNLGKGAAAAVVLTLLVLLMFVLLIYLKIKAATSGAKGSKGKYSKRKRACIAYMESTVVDISIPPPSFKPVSLSWSRSPLS